MFTGFQEGKIKFPPTYRMERGKGNNWNYNNKKNQNPSWTDRVLWRSCQGKHNRVKLEQYTAAHELVQSDHRPVHASFIVGCDVRNVVIIFCPFYMHPVRFLLHKKFFELDNLFDTIFYFIFHFFSLSCHLLIHPLSSRTCLLNGLK